MPRRRAGDRGDTRAASPYRAAPALQAERLEQAAQHVDRPAVNVELLGGRLELLAGAPLPFHLLALERDHRGAAHEDAFSVRDVIGAAEV